MKKNIIIFLILIAVIFLIVFKKDEQNIFKEKYETDDVYYQIFVRSFADSDNDGIGDFNGISQNIDYFVDLGITEMIKLTNDRKQLNLIIDQAHELLKKKD